MELTINPRPSVGFDLGCAAALGGDLAVARQRFDAARVSIHALAKKYGPDDSDDAFLAAIDTATEALEVGPAAFAALMDRSAREAAAFHGFCPPTTSSAPPLGADPS